MIESVTEKITHTTTVTGGATAVVGGLTFNEYLAAFGLLIALASFIVNVIYKERHYRLAREKLAAGKYQEYELDDEESDA